MQLSKTVSHALRHEPWLYELELDDEGWVPITSLLAALRNERAERQGISEHDLAMIIAQSDKRRFEIRNGQIRALYGHSVPQRLIKVSAIPPETLYHGTSEHVLAIILAEGLQPMARQYVHCSVDQETAQQVAARKRGRSIVLTVHARAAHENGIRFYRGNEMVWLADTVPPQFIEAVQ